MQDHFDGNLHAAANLVTNGDTCLTANVGEKTRASAVFNPIVNLECFSVFGGKGSEIVARTN